MSTFEIRANNYLTAIQTSSQRINDFGYADEEPEEVVSRIYSSFVVWLTACEEARAQQRLGTNNASFGRDVVEALPLADDPSWGTYIQPLPNTTLRARAEGLWGIRVAATHGDGDLLKIRSARNRGYASNAPNVLPGLTIRNDNLYVSSGVTHYAVRTIVQIQDVLL